MRKVLILAVLSLGLTAVQAQKAVTAGQFLASAAESEIAGYEQTKTDFLQNRDFTLPWVQELEFRTETHDFRWDEQEYTLRLSPNLPHQQRRQREYHQAFRELTEAQNQRWLAEALAEKYELLTDYVFVPQLLEVQQNLRRILLQKQKILRGRVTSPTFDLNNLVTTEEDIFAAEEEILELRQDLTYLREMLLNTAGTDSVTLTLLTVAQIEKKLSETTEPAPTEENILRLRQNLLQAEYNRELAAINNPLDFVQAKYGGRNSDIFRQDFSVGLGFRFPFKGDNKLDLLELEYEQTERSVDYLTDRAEQNKDIDRRVRNLKNLIEKYRLLQTQSVDTQTEYALRQLEQMSDADPLQILRLRLILLNRREQLLRTEYRIYRAYTDWLHRTERTIVRPLRNLLSAAGEEIQRN